MSIRVSEICHTIAIFHEIFIIFFYISLEYLFILCYSTISTARFDFISLPALFAKIIALYNPAAEVLLKLILVLLILVGQAFPNP